MKDYSHVKALVDIADDVQVYCYKNRVYEITYIDKENKVYHIHCEQDEDSILTGITASENDPEFEFLMLEEEDNNEG